MAAMSGRCSPTESLGVNVGIPNQENISRWLDFPKGEKSSERGPAPTKQLESGRSCLWPRGTQPRTLSFAVASDKNCKPVT